MRKMIVLAIMGFFFLAACRKSTVSKEQETISGTGTLICGTDVNTYAGTGVAGFLDGSLLSAQFYFPTGIAVNPSLPFEFYVSERNEIIRRLYSGNVSLYAGAPDLFGFVGGTTSARFSSPQCLAMDRLGNVYVADKLNSSIRIISPGGLVNTIAGFSGARGYRDGPTTAALFNFPSGIDLNNDGTALYVADQYNHRIRKIDLVTNMVSTIAGSATGGYVNDKANHARFLFPADVACAPDGSLYVTDEGNHCIRKIQSGFVTTYAGQTGAAGYGAGYVNGAATSARFRYPQGIDVDGYGKLYVCDQGNFAIRKIEQVAGSIYPLQVSTVAGTGIKGFRNGSTTVAQFSSPHDLSVNFDGSKIFVTDYDINRIRVITRSCISF